MKEKRTKPETVIQKQIERYLKSRGAWFYHAHGNGYCTTGIPDLIGCYKGLFFAIEVKTPKRYSLAVEPKEEQKTRLRQIDKVYGACCVATSVYDVVQFWTGTIIPRSLAISYNHQPKENRDTWEKKTPLSYKPAPFYEVINDEGELEYRPTDDDTDEPNDE